MNLRTAVIFGLLSCSATAAGARDGPPCQPEILSFEEIDIGSFNEEASAAASQGTKWPFSVMEVILHRVGFGDEFPAHYEMAFDNKSGGNPRQLTVTILEEGLADDSISGVWISLNLERSQEGVWRLTGERRAWRCARGDRVSTYEREPCP